MAAATLWEILDDLVDTLNDITGLHPLHAPLPRMNTPVAIPMLSEGLDPGWGGDVGDVNGTITVLVKYGATGQDGARNLFDYTSGSGTKSINQHLLGTHSADGALNGNTIKSIRLLGTELPKLYSYPNGEVYYGQEIRVKMYHKDQG